MESDVEEWCAGCGLVVAGGAEACQATMDEILALHFGNAVYFGVHRLFVDAYAVQHPERYCVSFKSLAAHLTHLCWSLEQGGSKAVPSEAIRRWVERHPHLEKPLLPDFRGELTIARSAWEAHAGLHAVVRGWVRSALHGD
jgi:hypothetical protein